jgi:hypothetical protein
LNSYQSQGLGREYSVRNMHIKGVNLPTESSFEIKLQAKGHSCYLHNDYEEKLNSWILLNMSLRSDLTFVVQIEKLLSFCQRISELIVYQKAESTWNSS